MNRRSIYPALSSKGPPIRECCWPENPDLPAALDSYARKRRLHVKLYQGLSRVFTPFYQSDSLVLPLFRDHLVAALSRVPHVQRLLASIVSGQLGLSRSLTTR